MRIQEIETMHKEMEQYAMKLDSHYKEKKKEYAESEKSWNEKVKSFHEEKAFYINKCESMKFEMEQLTKQKDCANKKLLADESLAFSYQQNKRSRDTILSTPKSKYMDDTEIKYTSPGLTSSQIIQSNPDDMSRRFSIDSYSLRGSNNVSMANQSINAAGSFQNMPALNRFNAISENDGEDQYSLQKSIFPQQTAAFQMNDSTNSSNAMRRLSTIQTRNKQQKPHLQSSYALEDVTQSVNEHALRGETFGNKENNRVYRNKKFVKFIFSIIYLIFIFDLDVKYRINKKTTRGFTTRS